MLIPANKQQYLMDALWPILVYAENNVETNNFLIRREIETAFKILNEIGLTPARPRWVKEGR